MKRAFQTKHFALLGIGLGLMIPAQPARADEPRSLSELSALWWQWGLSIPTAQNPQLDTTGENCMIGQRGSLWFLAGTWLGGTATRTCSIPEDKVLFFPVLNSVQVNAPNVCGQGPQNISVQDLRQAASAGLIGATGLSVEVDGKPVNNLLRIQSDVFDAALPENNIFDAPCAPANVPAGIYSPAVDDGFYARLDPLKIGQHTLHIHSAAQGLVVDVTYKLTVVPVLEK